MNQSPSTLEKEWQMKLVKETTVVVISSLTDERVGVDLGGDAR
jgi:hypothetical protein